MLYKPGKFNPVDDMFRHALNMPDSPEYCNLVEGYVKYIAENAVPKYISLDEIQRETEKDVLLQTVIKMIT